MPYLQPHVGHRSWKFFNKQLCSQNRTLLINMHVSAKLLLFALYKLFLTAYFPLFKQTMTFVTMKYISRRKVILWQKGPVFYQVCDQCLFSPNSSCIVYAVFILSNIYLLFQKMTKLGLCMRVSDFSGCTVTYETLDFR